MKKLFKCILGFITDLFRYNEPETIQSESESESYKEQQPLIESESCIESESMYESLSESESYKEPQPLSESESNYESLSESEFESYKESESESEQDWNYKVINKSGHMIDVLVNNIYDTEYKIPDISVIAVCGVHSICLLRVTNTQVKSFYTNYGTINTGVSLNLYKDLVIYNVEYIY